MDQSPSDENSRERKTSTSYFRIYVWPTAMFPKLLCSADTSLDENDVKSSSR